MNVKTTEYHAFYEVLCDYILDNEFQGKKPGDMRKKYSAGLLIAKKNGAKIGTQFCKGHETIEDPAYLYRRYNALPLGKTISGDIDDFCLCNALKYLGLGSPETHAVISLSDRAELLFEEFRQKYKNEIEMKINNPDEEIEPREPLKETSSLSGTGSKDSFKDALEKITAFYEGTSKSRVEIPLAERSFFTEWHAHVRARINGQVSRPLNYNENSRLFIDTCWELYEIEYETFIVRNIQTSEYNGWRMPQEDHKFIYHATMSPIFNDAIHKNTTGICTYSSSLRTIEFDFGREDYNDIEKKVYFKLDNQSQLPKLAIGRMIYLDGSTRSFQAKTVVLRRLNIIYQVFNRNSQRWPFNADVNFDEYIPSPIRKFLLHAETNVFELPDANLVFSLETLDAWMKKFDG